MFTQLAKLLGIPSHAAEDALHSTALAKAHLTRRELFGGSLALLVTKTYGLPVASSMSSLKIIGRKVVFPLFTIYESPLLPLTSYARDPYPSLEEVMSAVDRKWVMGPDSSSIVVEPYHSDGGAKCLSGGLS